MDSVSQALWGGLSAVALRKKTKVRHDFIFGAIGGTLPDLDAWIGRLSSPLNERLWHRGPSHSLLLLGLIGLGFLWFTKHRAHTIRTKFVPLWIGAMTHPLLDILTGFETAVAYPLFEPISVGWFPVLEPIFLLLLLIGGIRTLFTSAIQSARRSLLGACCWIALVGVHHSWVYNQVQEDLADHIESDATLLVRPMLGSFLTYRVLWKTEAMCHMAGYQPWTDGGSVSPLVMHPRIGALPDSEFSERLLRHGCFRELEAGVYGDLRFALLPSSGLPLWVWYRDAEGTWQREARRALTAEDKASFFSLWRGERQKGWIQPDKLNSRSSE